MAARKLSRTDRYYLELFTCYGLHSVNLAQSIYDLFLESYRDSSEQGQVEQRKLLSRLTEVLLHHINLIIEGIEERQKAYAQEERVIYNSVDPADDIDEHYLSLITMYGRHWIGSAHGASNALEIILFDKQGITDEDIENIITGLATQLKQFHDLVEESLQERQKYKTSQTGSEGEDTQDM